MESLYWSLSYKEDPGYFLNEVSEFLPAYCSENSGMTKIKLRFDKRHKIYTLSPYYFFHTFTMSDSSDNATQATIFSELTAIHPLSEFDEAVFLDLLEHSLSLSVTEKKRVIDAIPTLSQFQIDELTKVFVDEREEFKKLLSKEGDTIKELVVKARDGWKQLGEIYVQERAQKEKQNEDQAKIEEMKKSLGI